MENLFKNKAIRLHNEQVSKQKETFFQFKQFLENYPTIKTVEYNIDFCNQPFCFRGINLHDFRRINHMFELDRFYFESNIKSLHHYEIFTQCQNFQRKRTALSSLVEYLSKECLLLKFNDEANLVINEEKYLSVDLASINNVLMYFDSLIKR